MDRGPDPLEFGCHVGTGFILVAGEPAQTIERLPPSSQTQGKRALLGKGQPIKQSPQVLSVPTQIAGETKAERPGGGHRPEQLSSDQTCQKQDGDMKECRGQWAS